ncbi:ecotin [Pseudotamlana carrageenivorans]|uniref:Proteinase inhibitor n=1 Tax=Pseudotamlana carrageenivorans TaxID=2069432 RepID=A0A2I7SDV7_9FLAO|nr:ecotin family protein [Tamlana carrageenivorans]AUS04079.1 proteinase inhibitor [Tamlana carrageenivorans]
MKFNFLIMLALIVLFSCKAQNNTTTTKNSKTEMTATTKTHDISMYPEASNDQLRHIINLPATEDDNAFKVELYAGKIGEVDCNQAFLSGEFQEETVSGWGYPYYNFITNGAIFSTGRLCPDETKYKAFVSTKGELMRYNSKLPIVVYTPKGYEVRYKIWARNNVEQTAIIK